MLKASLRHLPFWISLALTLVVVSLGALSFQRKVETFQTLGFAAEPEGGGWMVTRVDEPETGLTRGDLILLVNGSELPATLEGLREALHRGEKSEVLVRQGGEIEALTYARPPLDLDYPYLILALIGGLYLLIGLYTLLKNRERQTLLFYFWCLLYATVFLLSAGETYDLAGRILYISDEVARILLPAVTIHLFLVFPATLSEGHWSRRLIPFVYLPAAFLLALTADLILADGRWLLQSPGAETRVAAIRLLDSVNLYHLVLYTLAAAALLGYRIFQRRDWEERRQVQWLALGMVGGYLPFLVFLLFRELPQVGPLVFFHQEAVEALAVLPLALVPLTFAWAILRYKLWDIEVLVRDTVSLTVTVLIGVIGFSLVNLAISRGVPEELGLARNLASFTAGLMIAGLVAPARRRIATSLERLQYRATYSRRRGLNEFADHLLQERDLELLSKSLLEYLEDAVELERANLLVVRNDELVPLEPERDLPPTLPLDGLGDELWEAEVQGISGIAMPDGKLSPRQRLFLAGYRYAFPLTVEGRATGAVITGYRLDSKPLNSDDLELIRNLLNQASLALENARLLGELRLRLAEVGQLKHFSESIVESSPAGIAVIDAENRLVSVNRAFAEHCPPPREELLGQHLETFLPVRPLPPPGEDPREVSYCRLNGDEHHLQLSVANFTGDDGSDGRGGDAGLRILVVYDVSSRIAMEHAMREQDRLASLGMLAAGVAHEVNTPLTGISSYAQMLLDSTGEEDPRTELMRKVEQQTFRASRIVNNLLEFARNRRDEYHNLKVAPLITDTLELLKERLVKGGVRAVWEPPAEPDGALEVVGSDGELQQVLTNLILNARDAMADQTTGGGVLTLHLSADADTVQLVVEDNGPGIPPERLERIFQPFFSTKLTRGGTGLGLSISYDIVRRHGGTMKVDSTPGEGTRFTIELPRARTATEATH